MKKIIIKSVILFIFLLTGAGMMATPVHAKAKKTSLREDKPYTINLDSCGKAEKVVFTETGSFSKRTFKVYVNDQVAFSDYLGDGTASELYTLRLANGQRYIYVHISGDSSWHDFYLLRYGDGQLKKVFDFTKLPGFSKKSTGQTGYIDFIKDVTVNGNNIALTMNYNSNMTACIGLKMKYVYKDGALRLSSRKSTSVMMGGLWQTTDYYKAQKTLQVYKEQDTGTRYFKIKAGARVYVKQFYFQKNKAVWIKVKSGGKVGWIRLGDYFVKDDYTWKSAIFQDLIYVG